jgi:hypothetical protein
MGVGELAALLAAAPDRVRRAVAESADPERALAPDGEGERAAPKAGLLARFR